MGLFVVSRSAEGDRFLLRSAAGQTLTVSKPYATLDACKKGMRSLVAAASAAPVTERAAAPNPKFLLIREGERWRYMLRSPNGKTLVASGDFATRKAVLRAVAMLRAGVADPVAVFAAPTGEVPLSVRFEAPQRPTVRAVKTPLPAPTTPQSVPEAPQSVPEPPQPAKRPAFTVRKVPTAGKERFRRFFEK